MLNRVSGQMYFQAGCICITTVTVVTLVRFVFVVLTSMRLQMIERNKHLTSYELIGLMTEPSKRNSSQSCVYKGAKYQNDRFFSPEGWRAE